MTVVRRLSSDELTPREVASLRTLVRLTTTSPDLDLAEPISCDWRPGDVW